MVISKLVEKTVGTLKNKNIENAVFEANLIVRTVLGLKPIDMVLSKDKNVDKEDIEKIEKMVSRRLENEPLQYILGTQEFMGLEFLVDKNVLIPRQDTETLVEEILKENRGMSVLDLCSGSGCIGISIAHFNKNAHITGVDISTDAIELASKNAEKLKVSDRVKFEKADVLKDTIFGSFDIIVSNPPYIESEEIEKLEDNVRLYEPRLALDGGEDGMLFYRKITEIAPTMLSENGILYFEVGYNQAEKVKSLMEKNFKDIKIVKDLCGVDRVVYGTKSEGK